MHPMCLFRLVGPRVGGAGNIALKGLTLVPQSVRRVTAQTNEQLMGLNHLNTKLVSMGGIEMHLGSH
jgi:phosphoketolase